MNGVDSQTRDLATMRNGVAFVSYAFEKWGRDCPVSGDELAKIRAEKKTEAAR